MTVYITEYVSSRISVFCTSGEFVHSFGKFGSGRGELRFPCGIAIDQDGFVFVCDADKKTYTSVLGIMFICVQTSSH